MGKTRALYQRILMDEKVHKKIKITNHQEIKFKIIMGYIVTHIRKKLERISYPLLPRMWIIGTQIN